MTFFSFKYRSSHLLQITIVIIIVIVFSVIHFTDEETGDLDWLCDLPKIIVFF